MSSTEDILNLEIEELRRRLDIAHHKNTELKAEKMKDAETISKLKKELGRSPTLPQNKPQECEDAD